MLLFLWLLHDVNSIGDGRGELIVSCIKWYVFHGFIVYQHLGLILASLLREAREEASRVIRYIGWYRLFAIHEFVFLRSHCGGGLINLYCARSIP